MLDEKEYVLKFKLILLSAMLMAAGLVHAEDAPLKTDKEMLSYSIGASTAKNLKKSDIQVDPELVLRGLKDGLASDKLLLTDKQIMSIMNGLMNDVKRATVANRKEAAEKNQKLGAEFLEANKKAKGVVTLPSGVQYQILKAGSGKKPGDADMVVCNYRGTLIDGTEFDSTEAGKPANIKVSALVAGWREAIKLMPEGSKWRVYIPSGHAYAERGVGTIIGPNETLIFELELVSVK
jgi:FKBP-type peptidyl-prolyl cis-trans isomerase FklB